MAYSSRSTSPDPLVEPSTRLVSQSSIAARRTSAKPLAPRSSNVVKPSPSKSFIMDTGAPGDASPWLIKVTVEAEPKDESSPAKKMVRTTKVPLKGGSSSSPVKRNARPRRKSTIGVDEESEAEIKRPQRKRKGTPIRRSTRKAQSEEAEDDDVVTATSGGIILSQQLKEELSSPSKRPIPPKKGRAQTQVPTERSKRLSQARVELGATLQAAVGDGRDSDDHRDQDEPDRDIAPGDITVANEDFTMVSVDTLQSMKQNTSQLLDDTGIDKSAISVSYMPSSPPQMQEVRVQRAEVRYLNISIQAEEAKERPAVEVGYDAMSWKPTGLAKTATPPTAKVAQQRLDREPTEWRLRRQAISQEIENASASQVMVIEDDDAQSGASESDQRYEEAKDEDIWAEEASRSIDEDQQQQHAADAIQPANTAAAINDLFSDQPQRPLRSKIPRTWRRSSGMDFSYVDSPEYGALKTGRKVSATDTEGEEGGVLTPPESSDEDDDVLKYREDAVHEEDDGIDLTHPDAAATQLQAREEHDFSPVQRMSSHFARREANEALNPSSESSSNVTSPDTEKDDTGMFWQTHLPNVYHRQQRPRLLHSRPQRAVDLSDLLRQAKESSPVIKQPARQNETSRIASAKQALTNSKSPLTMEASLLQKAVSSPLRKSLLKSSKIGGSVLSSAMHPNENGPVKSHETESTIDWPEHAASFVEQSSIGESFDSKASDQRQLLAEMVTASAQNETRPQPISDYSDIDGHSQSYVSDSEDTAHNQIGDQSEDSDNEGCDHDLAHEQNSRSYEERLNIESPQKIKVNFNDSEGNSSLLVPRKEYPPLFSEQRTAVQSQRAVSNVAAAKRASTTEESQPGILSRLSTSFWSAVIRPSGPAIISPEPEAQYSPSLRAQIRSRYGVLSDQHPWTMAHMRTLHRLLNSCTSGKSDSIVPKTGPLPPGLRRLVGKELQCVTEFRWKFSEQHAHVVDAFMQVLVPAHYIEAMRCGEVEFIGDSEAKKHRGQFGGRHGDDLVFGGVAGVTLPKGTITKDFVVKALGNAVSANIETAKRISAEPKQAKVQRHRSEHQMKSADVEISSEDLSTDEGSDPVQRVTRI